MEDNKLIGKRLDQQLGEFFSDETHFNSYEHKVKRNKRLEKSIRRYRFERYSRKH